MTYEIEAARREALEYWEAEREIDHSEDCTCGRKFAECNVPMPAPWEGPETAPVTSGDDILF